MLTYNLVLLAGFALTGWAMCLVLARWTGDWIAGIAGGILMAFNAHTLTRLPHLQMQHVEFLPFALLALDALLVAPGIRHAIALAGLVHAAGADVVLSAGVHAIALAARHSPAPRHGGEGARYESRGAWRLRRGRRRAAAAVSASRIGASITIRGLHGHWTMSPASLRRGAITSRRQAVYPASGWRNGHRRPACTQA